MNESIKIAGIIFYVESKAYKKLYGYLKTLTQYFSQFDEGREIMEDIEARMAELFYEKTNQHAQIISEQDVEEVIACIGEVEDFIDAENNPAYQMTYQDLDLDIPTENDVKGTALQRKFKDVAASRGFSFNTSDSEEDTDFEKFYEDFKAQFYDLKPVPQKGFKKLYRDIKRKIFGGVASGLGHYFKIDRTLVRMAFIALFTGVWFIPALPETMVLFYLAGWLIIPGERNLPDLPEIKRLYRNLTHKKLGGVASGIADFLSIEPKKVRLIFAGMSLLFGSGIFLYILMWIFMPKPSQ